jgi:hypothetical protein
MSLDSRLRGNEREFWQAHVRATPEQPAPRIRLWKNASLLAGKRYVVKEYIQHLPALADVQSVNPYRL